MTRSTRHLDPIGLFTRDDELGWMISGSVELEYLKGNRIQFEIDEMDWEPDMQDFSQAISSLMALTRKDRKGLNRKLYKDYLSYLQCVDSDLDFVISRPKKVWRHAVFNIIKLVRDDETGDVCAIIMGECDWEIEHGIQAVLHNGETLVRISTCDAHVR